MNERAGHDTGARPSIAAGEKVRDPVCGMQLEASHVRGHRQVEGADYFFCSSQCVRPAADPARPPMSNQECSVARRQLLSATARLPIDPPVAILLAKFLPSTPPFCFEARS